MSRDRAQWTALGLTANQYDFEFAGTDLFVAEANKHLRLEARDGVVRSSIDLTTAAPLARDPSELPTIDGLIDRAEHAAHVGSLLDLNFDPSLGYPSTGRVTGEPDEAGTYVASDLRRTSP